ncbi:hypothetical protein LR48_Vigan03g103400 [Vigna angularis]|uniref:Major facilitator superfamily (MFS) profile domain-containing protein n=2 Tax=Phaseolus angularis TaxID=3914 RepID=A0A0L9U4Q6_PHAAN|nr:hypothetical protein LR48_Vigan03g103400 [Vigna angularis]BAT84187.1 hypothetical protein VIGAN_04148200 [Vigna angularis var. angularis]
MQIPPLSSANPIHHLTHKYNHHHHHPTNTTHPWDPPLNSAYANSAGPSSSNQYLSPSPGSSTPNRSSSSSDAQPSWHFTNADNDYAATATLCDLPREWWAWDRPSHASIVSDWGLQCVNSVISGPPASSFFVGCLVGGFALASFADSSLGQKNMLFFSYLIMGITSLLVTLSPNIWIYSTLKFLYGFARATIGTSALVLATEIMGKRRRDQRESKECRVCK